MFTLKTAAAIMINASLGLALFTMTGCGSSGGDGFDNGKSSGSGKSVGVFVDSPVEGLRYAHSKNLEEGGFTNAKGEFSAYENSLVYFYLGKYEIGNSLFSKKISPYSLYPDNDEAAINLAQLLQTIDKDSDASNGIEVEEGYNVLDGSSISLLDADFDTKMANILGSLVSETDAIAHLHSSLDIPVVSQGFTEEWINARTLYIVIEDTEDDDNDGRTDDYLLVATKYQNGKRFLDFSADGSYVIDGASYTIDANGVLKITEQNGDWESYTITDVSQEKITVLSTVSWGDPDVTDYMFYTKAEAQKYLNIFNAPSVANGFTQGWLNNQTLFGLNDWKSSPSSASQWESYQMNYVNGMVTNVNTPDGTFSEAYTVTNDGKIKVVTDANSNSYFTLTITQTTNDYIKVTKTNVDNAEGRFDSFTEYLYYDEFKALKAQLALTKAYTVAYLDKEGTVYSIYNNEVSWVADSIDFKNGKIYIEEGAFIDPAVTLSSGGYVLENGKIKETDNGDSWYDVILSANNDYIEGCTFELSDTQCMPGSETFTYYDKSKAQAKLAELQNSSPLSINDLAGKKLIMQNNDALSFYSNMTYVEVIPGWGTHTGVWSVENSVLIIDVTFSSFEKETIAVEFAGKPIVGTNLVANKTQTGSEAIASHTISSVETLTDDVVPTFSLTINMIAGKKLVLSDGTEINFYPNMTSVQNNPNAGRGVWSIENGVLISDITTDDGNFGTETTAIVFTEAPVAGSVITAYETYSSGGHNDSIIVGTDTLSNVTTASADSAGVFVGTPVPYLVSLNEILGKKIGISLSNETVYFNSNMTYKVTGIDSGDGSSYTLTGTWSIENGVVIADVTMDDTESENRVYVFNSAPGVNATFTVFLTLVGDPLAESGQITSLTNI